MNGEGICLRKARYATWEEAEASALRVMDEGLRQHTDAYRCVFCNGWHFGHPPRVRLAHVNDPERGRYIRTKVVP